MGISKIGSLFASNIDPVVRQSALSKRSAAGQAQNQSDQVKASSDAVVYTPSSSAKAASSSRATDSSDSARASRVRDLKSQVDSGAYVADSDKVAVAILKELA